VSGSGSVRVLGRSSFQRFGEPEPQPATATVLALARGLAGHGRRVSFSATPQHVISGQPQSRGIRGVRARCVDPAPALSCTTMADGWCPLLCRATSWSLEEWRCFFSCFCLHGAAPRNSLVLCPALYVRVPVRVPLESQKKSVTDWIRYRQHGGSPIAGCN
jgi:hypothetical protein